MIDYTKLRKKLIPEPDGEPPVVMRTGTIDAVNSDGTVDVEMSSGIILPDIPRLASAGVAVGVVVNIISFRGSLLVIGPSASNGYQFPAMQAGTALASTVGSSTGFTTAVVFPDAYPVGVTPHVRLDHNDGAAAAQFWVIRAASITNTGFNIFGTRAAAAVTLTNSPVDWNSFVP